MTDGFSGKVFEGDGIAGLASLPEGSVDMILTDPPYGTTCCEWDTAPDWDAFWKAARHAVKPSGAILIFTQVPASTTLAGSNPRELRYSWTWVKNISTGFLNANRMPLKAHEDIYVFYRRLPTYNPQWRWERPGRNTPSRADASPVYNRHQRMGAWASPDGKRHPRDVLEFSVVHGVRGKGRDHPTEKPTALCEYLIRTYTNPGDLVADPFAGSGTLAEAAAASGRRFACWEKDHGWAEHAQRRAEAALMRGAQMRIDDMDMTGGDA